MLGTIRPSWEYLNCLKYKDSVANAMCKSCRATASQFGNKGRGCLSYDAIFLTLFSEPITSTRIKLPMKLLRCFVTPKYELSADERFLGSVSILMSKYKLQDAILDGEVNKGLASLSQNLSRINNSVLDSLSRFNLSVSDLDAHIQEYTKIEEAGLCDSFEALSQPIAEAYGLVFSNLPSIAKNETSTRTMFEIGMQYARLTLLIDAVEDCAEDARSSSYNIWRSSTNLPQDLPGIMQVVSDMFYILKTKSIILSDMAAGFIAASEGITLKRLQISLNNCKCGKNRTMGLFSKHVNSFLFPRYLATNKLASIRGSCGDSFDNCCCSGPICGCCLLMLCLSSGSNDNSHATSHFSLCHKDPPPPPPSMALEVCWGICGSFCAISIIAFYILVPVSLLLTLFNFVLKKPWPLANIIRIRMRLFFMERKLRTQLKRVANARNSLDQFDERDNKAAQVSLEKLETALVEDAKLLSQLNVEVSNERERIMKGFGTKKNAILQRKLASLSTVEEHINHLLNTINEVRSQRA